MIAEYALDGLKQVMFIKSRVVLPYLVPQLTEAPVNTEALCILASVAGESLTKHLVKILPALVSTLSEVYATEGREKEAYEVALTNCQGVVFAVTDVTGITIILDELMSYTKTRNKEEASQYSTIILRITIIHLQVLRTTSYHSSYNSLNRVLFIFNSTTIEKKLFCFFSELGNSNGGSPPCVDSPLSKININDNVKSNN